MGMRALVRKLGRLEEATARLLARDSAKVLEGLREDPARLLAPGRHGPRPVAAGPAPFAGQPDALAVQPPGGEVVSGLGLGPALGPAGAPLAGAVAQSVAAAGWRRRGRPGSGPG